MATGWTRYSSLKRNRPPLPTVKVSVGPMPIRLEWMPREDSNLD